MKDRRRFFSRSSERIDLLICSDGRCVLCGCELGDDWHADHITPHSKGGPTTFENAQATCPRCNMKKADKIMKIQPDIDLPNLEGDNTYLPEQVQAVEKHRELRGKQQAVTKSMAPGLGKTLTGLAITSDLLANGLISHMVVVSPYTEIMSGWEEASREFFGDRLYAEQRSPAQLMTTPKDIPIIVTSYQAVAKAPKAFWNFCQKCRAGAMFDECHHPADTLAWGEGIKLAFKDAKYITGLTGTAFRSGLNERIAFARYEKCADDPEMFKLVPDFEISIETAIKRGRICVPRFPLHHAQVEATVGKQRKQKLLTHVNATTEEQSTLLNAAIDPSKSGAREQFTRAHEQLMKLRKRNRKAGGLLCAKSVSHAKACAQMIREITGEDPVIVYTPKSGEVPAGEMRERIKSYRDGTTPWIVAIDMIAEGCDIKRLKVVCYLSNVTSRSYLIQVWCRAIRLFMEMRGCYIFAPADRRIMAVAQEFIDAAKDAYKEEEDETEETDNTTVVDSDEDDPKVIVDTDLDDDDDEDDEDDDIELTPIVLGDLRPDGQEVYEPMTDTSADDGYIKQARRHLADNPDEAIVTDEYAVAIAMKLMGARPEMTEPDDGDVAVAAPPKAKPDSVAKMKSDLQEARATLVARECRKKGLRDPWGKDRAAMLEVQRLVYRKLNKLAGLRPGLKSESMGPEALGALLTVLRGLGAI